MKKTDSIIGGDTLHMALRRNPADSDIYLNNKRLESVTEISIKADANNQASITLKLDPSLMMISSDIEPGFRFDRPRGYDPYNSEAPL